MNNLKRLLPALIITLLLAASSLLYVSRMLRSLLPRPVKVVAITAAVDEEYRALYPDWKARVRDNIMSASNVYEHLADIYLVPLRIVAWNSPDDTRELADMRCYLPSRELDRADVVVGFTGQPASEYERSTGHCRLGVGENFGSKAIVRDKANSLESVPEEVFLHEIGHVLGLHHTNDTRSFMYHASRSYNVYLDDDNLHLLKIVRYAPRETRYPEFSCSDSRRLIPIYQRFIEQNPEDAKLMLRLGFALEKAGYNDEAVRTVRKSITLAGRQDLSTLCDAHFALANMYARQDRTDAAIREQRQCIRLNPDAHNPHCCLGCLLSYTGRYAEAEHELSIAHKNYPDCLFGHFHLGRILLKKHKYAEAEKELRIAVSLGPDRYASYLYLSLAFDGQKKYEEEASLLRKVNYMKPNDVFVLSGLAWALANLNHLDAARRLCRQALEIDPKSSLPHHAMACVFEKKNDYASAWRQVKLCRKLGGKPETSFINKLKKHMPEPKD